MTIAICDCMCDRCVLADDCTTCTYITREPTFRDVHPVTNAEDEATLVANRPRNLPRTSAKNTTGRCSGMYACSADTDGRHCVCVQDHTPRPGSTVECCQCGNPRDEQCIRCGQALTNHDPTTTTLGPRCARCWRI